MSVASIMAAARGLLNAVVERNLPHEVVVKYPAYSPLAGQVAEVLLLKRNDNGSFGYEPVELEEPAPMKVRADLVIKHRFDDLASLDKYLTDREDQAYVFVETSLANPAQVVVLLDEGAPERGAVSLEIDRHPTFLRWWEGLARRDTVDLTHQQLADLLLDNAEDLEDQTVARMLASFRAATKIVYDGNFNADGGMVVSVKWDGKADVAGTAMSVPRDVVVLLAPYQGAWDPGAEPRLRAVLRLRVLPPKDAADPAPKFRVRWVNLHDWEQASAEALHDRVRSVIAERHEVFLGKPDATKYVLPTKAE